MEDGEKDSSRKSRPNPKHKRVVYTYVSGNIRFYPCFPLLEEVINNYVYNHCTVTVQPDVYSGNSNTYIFDRHSTNAINLIIYESFFLDFLSPPNPLCAKMEIVRSSLE